MLLQAPKILTLDPTQDTNSHNTICIEQGRVKDLTNSPISTPTPFADCIIMPGFVEHHCHFQALAAAQSQVQLHNCETLLELLTTVQANDADWVIGTGWISSIATSSNENIAQLLNDAVDGRPITLISRDGHAVITTPQTLDHIGANLADLAISGGVIELDSKGVWSGVLREQSAWAIRELSPVKPNLDAIRSAIKRTASAGVTLVHDMDGLASLKMWSKLAVTDEKLDIRCKVHLHIDDLPHLQEAKELASSSEYLSLGGLKLFADGTLGSGTALLHEPELSINGEPARSGVEILSKDALERYANQAGDLGLSILVHAIGDLAVTNVIDALEASKSSWKGLEAAPRIEHMQLAKPEDIERCANLGIECSVQPTMLITDRVEATRLWGEERSKNAYAYQSMLESGCALRFGSDAPIEPLDPLAAIHAAVHRNGGSYGLTKSPTDWHSEQKITPHAALEASIKEPLGIGAPADLVVLDKNPLSSTKDISVRTTLLAGRITYDTKQNA